MVSQLTIANSPEFCYDFLKPLVVQILPAVSGLCIGLSEYSIIDKSVHSKPNQRQEHLLNRCKYECIYFLV